VDAHRGCCLEARPPDGGAERLAVRVLRHPGGVRLEHRTCVRQGQHHNSAWVAVSPEQAAELPDVEQWGPDKQDVDPSAA